MSLFVYFLAELRMELRALHVRKALHPCAMPQLGVTYSANLLDSLDFEITLPSLEFFPSLSCSIFLKGLFNLQHIVLFNFVC
jgi:hypothetical protein